jgi:hypothetical protein
MLRELENLAEFFTAGQSGFVVQACGREYFSRVLNRG